jgi:hypothetical protein
MRFTTLLLPLGFLLVTGLAPLAKETKTEQQTRS